MSAFALLNVFDSRANVTNESKEPAYSFVVETVSGVSGLSYPEIISPLNLS
jgi:hypothetical protein